MPVLHARIDPPTPLERIDLGHHAVVFVATRRPSMGPALDHLRADVIRGRLSLSEASKRLRTPRAMLRAVLNGRLRPSRVLARRARAAGFNDWKASDAIRAIEGMLRIRVL